MTRTPGLAWQLVQLTQISNSRTHSHTDSYSSHVDRSSTEVRTHSRNSTHARTHSSTCTRVHTPSYAHTLARTCTHSHERARAPPCTCTRVHAHSLHAHTHAHTHTHTLPRNTHTHTHTHTNMHTRRPTATPVIVPATFVTDISHRKTNNNDICSPQLFDMPPLQEPTAARLPSMGATLIAVTAPKMKAVSATHLATHVRNTGRADN